MPEKDLANFTGGGEGRGADGIIKIKGDAHQDEVMSQSLNLDENTVNLNKDGVSQYELTENSCATYSKGAVESVGISGSSNSTVKIVGKTTGITFKTEQVTTPGSVHVALANSKDNRVVIIKNLPAGNGNPNIKIIADEKKIIDNLKRH